MDILVFKTNLRFKKNINQAVSHIDNIPGILRWNVDLQDRDKVLRIESNNLAPQLVEKTLTDIGFFCKELE
jgi:copper chaperone